MNMRKFIRLMLCLGGLLTALTPWDSLAQRQDVPARIALKDHSGAIDVLLTGRRGSVLHARLGENATGSITYEVADVRRLTIAIPQEALRHAEAAAAAGNIGDAVRRMRVVIQPIIPYLDLPVEGAIAPALRYAEFLRREKSWAAAISVYRSLNGNPDRAIREQAVGWLAYCHVRNQQAKEAQSFLDTFKVEDPRHAGFIPGTIAASYVKASVGDDEAALDLAARAASLSRIDHELYPEAVFLAAGSYLRLSEKAAAQPVLKDVVIKKTGSEEPPPPAMLPVEFLEVASNLYQRIVQLFPSSSFSADAAQQLEVIRKSGEQNSSSLTTESGVLP